MYRFLFTIVFFGKRKDNTHQTFHILKMKAHLKKEPHLEMKTLSKTHLLFQSKTTAQESTTNRLGLTKITTETTESDPSSSSKPSLLNSLKFDDVSAFLPPGFNPSAIEKPEVTTSSTPTTEKSNGFKLGISSLFDDIKTDDVAALLPPGMI